MRQTRKLVLLLGILTVVSSLAACGGGEEATPVPTATTAPPTAIPQPTATPRPQPTATPAAPTGTLSVAFASFSNETLRPSKGRFGGTQTYLGSLYDWLLHAAPDGSLIPGIARQWQLSPDGKSWTVTLRDDMRFHNGDQLTAADIKFSFENTIKDYKGGGGATFGDIMVKSVASVDERSPTVVQINLANPWPLFPADVNSRSGPSGAIVPKAYYERVSATGFEKSPVGTGPWKFKQHEPGVRIVMEASSTPHPFRQTPTFKELHLLLVPEDVTRVAMLKTGSADLIDIGSADVALSLQKDGFQILNTQYVNMGFVHLYGSDDARIAGQPLANIQVRQAMVIGVDRKAIIETVYGGFATLPARPYMIPGADGYDPNTKPDDFQPDRAKELLAQAGYARGFGITVFNFPGPGVPWLPKMMEAVAGYWSALGIQPRIFPTDFATFSGKYRARPQTADLIGAASPLWGALAPNALGGLNTSYHSKAITLVTQRPELDTLLEQAFVEADTQKRHDLVRRFVDGVHARYVTIPVATGDYLVGMSKRLAGMETVAAFGIAISLETVKLK